MSPLELLFWALAVIAVIMAVLLVGFVVVWVFFVPRGRGVKASQYRNATSKASSASTSASSARFSLASDVRSVRRDVGRIAGVLSERERLASADGGVHAGEPIEGAAS
ncbi:hypothetical protein [Microbacterium xylanilyticum]